jgi:nuclear pore complex protein Nup107
MVIPLYASFLSSLQQIESLADYLLTVDTSKEQRWSILKQGQKYGLDLCGATRRTVQRQFEKCGIQNIGVTTSTTIAEMEDELSPRDVQLIRSLEWILFDPSYYRDALLFSNILIRHFLGKNVQKSLMK